MSENNPDSDDLDELREKTSMGSRVEEETVVDEEEAFRETIVEILEEIDAGERSKTLSARDERLMALFVAIDETDRSEELGAALAEDLNANIDQYDRSALMLLAMRAGLEHAAPETLEELRGAVGEYAQRQI